MPTQPQTHSTGPSLSAPLLPEGLSERLWLEARSPEANSTAASQSAATKRSVPPMARRADHVEPRQPPRLTRSTRSRGQLAVGSDLHSHHYWRSARQAAIGHPVRERRSDPREHLAAWPPPKRSLDCPRASRLRSGRPLAEDLLVHESSDRGREQLGRLLQSTLHLHRFSFRR